VTDLLGRLRSAVGVDHVLTDGPDVAAYVVDWTGTHRGRALAVVRPGSTAEVAEVVRACAEARTPLVPQGGNTGLVGGGVDVGVAEVLEDAEEPVEAYVDAGGLQHRGVPRVQRDPAGVDLCGDVAVGEQHAADPSPRSAPRGGLITMVG